MVVSLFEPHTDIIRKGKLTKPTEFGRLVKIQEAEAQFITDYAVCERRQADRALWRPALDRHIELFGRAPQLGCSFLHLGPPPRGLRSAASRVPISAPGSS